MGTSFDMDFIALSDNEIAKSKRWSGFLAPMEVQSQRSEVWKHFDLFRRVDSDGSEIEVEGEPVQVVRCRSTSCDNAEFSFSGSTHSMLRHIRRMHSEPEPNTQPRMKRIRRSGSSSNTVSNTTADDCHNAVEGSTRALFAAQDDLLTEFILGTGQPLSLLNNVHFRNFLKSLNKTYKLPDCRTFISTIVRRYMDFYESKRRSFFASICTLAVSIDEYSCPGISRNFLIFKGHGVKEDFTRFQVTLDVVPFSHELCTAASIDTMLHEMLNNCGLSLSQLTAIITDGAVNVEKAAGDLLTPWVPCLAHRVHLAVHEFLSAVTGMKELLQKVRKNVTILLRSANLQAQLESIFGELEMSSRRLVLDTPTKWHSTLNMLRAAKYAAPATNELAEHKFGANSGIFCITDEEMHALDALIKILEKFEEVTKEATKADSWISFYIPTVFGLINVFESMAVNSNYSSLVNEYASAAAKIVQSKFLHGDEKREDVLKNDALREAMFFDPRCCLAASILSPEEWVRIRTKIKLKLQSEACASETQLSPQNTSNKNTTSKDDTLAASVSQLVATVATEFLDGTSHGASVSATEAEISKYLRMIVSAENRVGPHIFWKHYSKLFPSLSVLAMKTMNAPLGSAEVEGFFNQRSCVLSNKSRDKLENDNIRNMLLLGEFIRKGVRYFDIDYSGQSLDDESEDCFLPSG